MSGLLVAFNSVLSRIPPRPLVVTGRTWQLFGIGLTATLAASVAV